MLKSTESLIEWRANSSGVLVAFENSQALGHFSDPAMEAYNWAKHITSNKVIVVGLGSSFHIQALREINPSCEMIVIDCRPALIGFYQRKLKDVEIINVHNFESLKKNKRVREIMEAGFEKHLFKPALGVQKRFLDEIFWFLNIRTSEALAFFTGNSVNLPTDVLINAKQFIENVNGSQIPYKNSEILTIQELMK